MPYNYQHKYFSCEYLLKPWVHLLSHKIRVFNNIPIEVRAPGSFLHVKEGPSEEELPLKSQFGLWDADGGVTNRGKKGIGKKWRSDERKRGRDYADAWRFIWVEDSIFSSTGKKNHFYDAVKLQMSLSFFSVLQCWPHLPSYPSSSCQYSTLQSRGKSGW